MQETAQKNITYSRNETRLKIGHVPNAIAHAKAITLAKWLVWVKNLNCEKHAKNHSTRTLNCFCAKSRPKKRHIFEKWHKVENPPSCKGYSPCKGSSLCKIVSLGEKLKMRKTCEKPFYKNIKVVLCKTPLEKTPNIREIRQVWKSAIL